MLPNEQFGNKKCKQIIHEDNNLKNQLLRN